MLPDFKYMYFKQNVSNLRGKIKAVVVFSTSEHLQMICIHDVCRNAKLFVWYLLLGQVGRAVGQAFRHQAPFLRSEGEADAG